MERKLQAVSRAYVKNEDDQRSFGQFEVLQALNSAGETWQDIARRVLANDGKNNPSQEEVDRKADALRKWFNRHKPSDQE